MLNSKLTPNENASAKSSQKVDPKEENVKMSYIGSKVTQIRSKVTGVLTNMFNPKTVNVYFIFLVVL